MSTTSFSLPYVSWLAVFMKTFSEDILWGHSLRGHSLRGHSLRMFSDDVLWGSFIIQSRHGFISPLFYSWRCNSFIFQFVSSTQKNAIPKILKKTKFWIFTIFSTNHNILMKKPPKIIYLIVVNAWIRDKSAFVFLEKMWWATQ